MLVTSAVPGEGKTALATALGRLAACSGKRVLLIDCDLRHPQVGRSLGQTSEHGIVELWEGRATIEQAFHFDEPSGLMFLPATGSVPFPGVILGSDFLRQLVEQARQQFDLVLFDSPPVGIVSDAMAAVGAGRRDHHDGPLGEDTAFRGSGRREEARGAGSASAAQPCFRTST